MHRTERKTEQQKQPEQERQQKQLKQGREAASEWAQTVEVILADGSWDQLPAERILGLSGVIGNSALAELFAMRSAGPELATRLLPDGELTTAPAEIAAPGGPLLVQQPFGPAAGPVGDTAPMML